MEEVLTKMTTSISDFRSDMQGTIRRANNEPFAVLSNNKPSFYVVPADLYDRIAEMLFDLEIAGEVKRRLAEGNFVSVDINDL